MESTIAAGSLRTVALGDLRHELASTRRVLERVPEEHAEWKPHARSMSLGGLATHLTNIPYWQRTILESDGFDLATAPPREAVLGTRREWLDAFDRNASALEAAMEGVDDAALMRMWTLRRGDHIVFSQPRIAALRGMGISHMIHHRGQMSVYLRLLDVPVPSIYGPSADEGFPG